MKGCLVGKLIKKRIWICPDFICTQYCRCLGLMQLLRFLAYHMDHVCSLSSDMGLIKVKSDKFRLCQMRTLWLLLYLHTTSGHELKFTFEEMHWLENKLLKGSPLHQPGSFRLPLNLHNLRKI